MHFCLFSRSVPSFALCYISLTHKKTDTHAHFRNQCTYTPTLQRDSLLEDSFFESTLTWYRQRRHLTPSREEVQTFFRAFDDSQRLSSESQTR